MRKNAITLDYTLCFDGVTCDANTLKQLKSILRVVIFQHKHNRWFHILILHNVTQIL